jgi:hypothetical protein
VRNSNARRKPGTAELFQLIATIFIPPSRKSTDSSTGGIRLWKFNPETKSTL